MRKCLFVLLFFCLVYHSQSQSADSLLHLLQKAKEDTEKVKLYSRLCMEYYLDNPDTAMLLVQEGLSLAEKNNYRIGEGALLSNMGDVYLSYGNYTKALEAQLKSLDVYEKIKAPEQAGNTLHAIALLYADQQEPRLALSFFLKENAALKIHPDEDGLLWNLLDISKTYAGLNVLDTSKIYSDQAIKVAKHYHNNNFPGYLLNTLGDLYAGQGQNELALSYYRQSIPDLIDEQYYREICQTYIGLAKLFKTIGQPDSSVYYAKKALHISQDKELLLAQLSCAGFLTTLYKSLNNIDSAFLYQELNTKIHDSLFSASKVKEFQNIRFSKQIEEREIESLKAAYRNRVKFYILAAVILAFLSVAIVLLRSNQHKQKANFLLNQQKLETDEQKSKVERAYQELQATQAQLIQSVKMASLGELTAGIAHEIQNPLNFVNNFSEVNTELTKELEQAIDSGNLADAKAIIKDIQDNEQKITQHGKRADSIVKGMLQHSRSGTGVKEPTNIKALAGEYLRLAYHGLRAKDKSFNATMKTDFEEAVPAINIIPQDFGRVLLNLYNNAFYSINEKKKFLAAASPEKPADSGYEPTISVTIKKDGAKTIISVTDNGNGIPKNIKDKIFQPFFTTKPAGEGTGLGLSLSYDIIKAHGGEIKVESSEGEGTAFIISLPS